MLLAIASAWTVPALAQSAYSRPGDPRNPLRATQVKNGLYLFSGSTNTLVRMSANGFILVDGQPPETHEALLAQIERLSEQPIRLVIATDHHPEHTRSNAQFLASGAQVLVQDNSARHLMANPSPQAKAAAPTKTYDRELDVSIGGVQVKVFHFGPAHTDGDSVVYFPVLKVVAVGDLLSAAPDPDFSAGGSLVGWSTVLAKVLELDVDVVVPGSGPPVSRGELVAFKKKIDTLVARATDLVRAGAPKATFMSRLRTDDLGWQLNFAGSDLDRVYAELSRTRASE